MERPTTTKPRNRNCFGFSVRAVTSAHQHRLNGMAAELAATRDLLAALRAREATLAHGEARQRANFKKPIAVAMVVTYPASIITAWNPGAEHVLG
jgi:hypothetical protein